MAVPKKLSASKTAITDIFTSKISPIRSNVQSAQVLEQPVEFLQSLELVQTLVCAVLSTVASLRGIFPEDCFKVHHFDVENLNYSYKNFIEATNEENIAAINTRDKKGRRYVPWEILSRGENASANKLLDWLELGVADALSHKYLSTLQLGIYEGQISPSKMVEAYVMAFSYHTDNIDVGFQLSADLRLPSQSWKSLGNSKQELRYLVHRLTNHIGGFPELPRESLVQMQLTYNNTCPPSYQPPGYVDSQDHYIILGRAQGALIGSTNTEYHRVKLSVFVNEDRTKVPSITKSGTVVTLRKPTKTLFQNQNTVKDVPGIARTEAFIESLETSIEIPPACVDLATQKEKHSLEKDKPNKLMQCQDQQVQTSIGTSTLDTQEKMQLAAIATMVQLRSDCKDMQETQVLESTQSETTESLGSVKCDKSLPDVDASSTQGTPSLIGHGRVDDSESESDFCRHSKTGQRFTTMRQEKRHFTPESAERSRKLQKVSKARSPFVIAHLRNLRHERR